MISTVVDARSVIEKRAMDKIEKYVSKFDTMREAINYYCECPGDRYVNCTCNENILPPDEFIHYNNIYITKLRAETYRYSRLISKIIPESESSFDSSSEFDFDSSSDSGCCIIGPELDCKKCSKAEWFAIYRENHLFDEYIGSYLTSVVLSDGKWYYCGYFSFHEEFCEVEQSTFNDWETAIKICSIMPKLYADYNKSIADDRLDIVSKVIPLLLSDVTFDVPFEVIGVIAVILYQI